MCIHICIVGGTLSGVNTKNEIMKTLSNIEAGGVKKHKVLVLCEQEAPIFQVKEGGGAYSEITAGLSAASSNQPS